MITIRFTFPGGRYHATPWDRHVNEGAVEWPPSPWRLVRALAATRHARAPEVDDEQLARLLGSLSASLPSYHAPAGVIAHTRHYMPPFKGNTSKVLDAFIDVRGQALHVSWDLELPSEQRDALGRLLDRLGYLGRAESWADAELVDDAPRPNVWATGSTGVIVNGTPLTLLAPLQEPDYAAWRARELERQTAARLAVLRQLASDKGKDPDRSKLGKRDIERLEAGLPRDLYEALHADTSALRKAGWSRPPGSCWADYFVAEGGHGAPRTSRGPRPEPTVVRLAVASQVLPRITDVVSVAERIHRAVASREPGPVFVGQDAGGKPLEGHRHAHILPQATGRHGQGIDRVSIFAPMGFDEAAMRALEGVVRKGVWGREGHELQLVLIATGAPDDFGGLDWRRDEDLLFATSTRWTSVTPFVPTRHPKRTKGGAPKLDADGEAIGSPRHDLLRLLSESGFPAPKQVLDVESQTLLGRRISWLDFHIDRKHGAGRRASSRGHGFELVFERPVRGPIALGYGAHFGLGVFVPAPS